MFTLASVSKHLKNFAIKEYPSDDLEIEDHRIKVCGTKIELKIGGNYIKHGEQKYRILADIDALLKACKVTGWKEFNLIKATKYSYHAYDRNNKKIATAPSIPKIKAKLNDIYFRDKPKKTAKKNSRPKKQKGESIKSITMDLIINGKEDQEIIDTIQSKYPDSKFDQRHISWYRSTLFRDGVITAEFAPRKSKAYKTFLKEKK